jgi:hypothetical protein
MTDAGHIVFIVRIKSRRLQHVLCMWLGLGRQCMQNFGGETCWKVFTGRIEKEMGG